IQLPLPRPSLQNLLDLIPVPIDIDLLSTKSHHLFYNNDFSRLPPVVRGVDLFLEYHRISPANLNVCILGFGDLVGKPVSSFLSAKGAQVTVYDNKYYDKDPANNDVSRLMKHANILFKPNYVPGTSLDCNLVIISIGIPNLILSRDIVSGASVIDFGYAVVNSKAVGDISLEQDLSHLNFLSPSPGGMGPLIVRFLVMNFLGI
ncbi:bifunctional 5,10-methylenetetrahydrofolate dehydrogenase/5,10-methenyltetrahydrofolate cyclohydrolase, partial [Patescibacteria group bacterium]|nr:bifunctional 5,10-methylenetetrahydrofolate dehydrogenase/5,10-methenyltetrahydrofolate cyclohydrolase [Patescibacteria group bacterium]